MSREAEPLQPRSHAAEQEPSYPSLQWVKAQLRTNPHARLSRRRHIVAAHIIGSEARGTATPSSDLDIAVIISTNRSRPTSLQLTEAYHAKFTDERQAPKWKGRKVDFEFFYETDADLDTYNKLPIG